MATDTLIQNIMLPVFNADETPFHGLALRRFTVESVVMSLGDKITGDVYYPDNNLLFTMQEYVVYNGVKYVMVNPPTIVKEGMVANNNELKGMTKYSLEFYHPMYQLGNMPFSDVAVTSDESRYLSESKKFSWIGKPNDFIAKINKNLEDTQWAVVKSSNFPSSVNNELSDVIPFEDATIADALKTMNDTWKLPYVVDVVASTDPLYAQGKRFKVVVGLPAEEIYPEGSQVPYVFRLGSGVGLKNNSRTPRNNKIVTRIAGYGSERNIPYGYPQIIWYGDQTWKYTINNDGTDPLSYPIYDGIVGGKWVKLIKHPFTRTHLMPKVYVERLFNKVSPYAVRVIPQIPSYTMTLDELYAAIDNLLANYTQSGSANEGLLVLKETIQDVVADGLAGTYDFGDGHTLQYEGKVVLTSDNLISGYLDVDDNHYPKFKNYTFNDVLTADVSSPVANQNYDPTLELIDYYDAIGEDYPNNINPAAPSYESHEFDDIYPRLGEEEIVSAVPYDGGKKDYIEYSEISPLFTKYIQKAANVVEDALLTSLKAKIETGNYYANGSTSFGGWWSCTYNLTNDEAFMYFEYKSVSEYNTEAIRFSFKALKQGAVPPAPDWDDTMDDKGEYIQSYFKLTIPQLTFDVYACASITEQMDIYMRSGACIGCTFPVQVDWDDYKLNFFDKDGNFCPDGAQRDLVKYPKSNEQSITVIAQKDINTFGTLMPNRYQQPQAGDEFVFLGISLPSSYISTAEEELENKSKEYMLDNNIYYFDYPVKLSEHFLENHKHILSQIKPNAIMRFEFAGEQKELFIKQVSTKVGFTPLPQYEITLTDNVEVVLNQIGETAERVSRLETLVGMLDQEELKNIWAAVQERLSKVDDDTAKGFIRFMKGLQVGENFTSGILGEGGVFRMNGDGTSYLEVDKMYVRMKAYFDNVEVKDYQHSSGNRMVTKAGAKICRVEWVDSQGEYVEQLDVNLSQVVKFRCFFKADNGEDTVRNDFVVDANGQQDLVYCNRTVIESGINKRWYWRAAIAKNATMTGEGEAWIDLSVTDCATDSDIPMAGDDIIQLGNRTDTDRQGAIVEYVGGEDAPSYQIFQGINTYNLNNKNYISLGYSTQTNRAYMNVYGDAYIGDHQGTTFVKYEQVNSQTNRPKLTIKAEVDIQSTFGGQSLQQRVEQYAPPYDDSWIQPAIDAVQAQIDGELDTYYLAGVPSLQLPPVVSTQAHPYDDPWLDGTETAEERQAILNDHVGDLYYDKNTGYVYRFLYDDDNDTFLWTQIHDDAISEALRIANDAQYTADGKSTIFLNNPENQDASKRYPTNYKKGDSWVLPSGSGEVNISNTSTQRKFKYGSILTTDVDMASTGYNPTDWSEKVRYTDDTKYDNFITALLNGMPSGSTEATVEAALNAIKAALNQGTTISGGLVLSTLIGLRDSNSVLWAGINGQYDANALGKGIAGWYGGAMADMGNMTEAQIDAWEAKTEAQKIADNTWAKTLFRFDGSGYLAANNIYWNAGGAMTIKNLQTIYGTAGDSVTINALSTLSGIFLTETYGSFNNTELLVNPQNAFSHLFINRTGNVVTYPSNLKTINDYAVLNFGEMKARFVTVDFFNALFQANDSSGNTIAVNTANPSIDNIKALVGLWTEQYLSALGQNSSGSGGGGGVDMTTVWTAMGQPTTEQINVTHLSNALSNYSTKLETIQNISVGTGANVGSYVVTRANGSQFAIGACNVVDIADYESMNEVLPTGNVMYVYEGMPVEYRRCSRHVSQQTTEVYMIFTAVRPNTSSSGYPYPQELYVFKRVSGSSSFIYDETVNWDDAENFIKQLFGYDMYLPLTGGQMSSQSLVEDLNADLLDGYHASAFLLKAGGTMSNANLVTNLNADLLDGHHSSEFLLKTGGTINDNTDTTIDIYSDGLTFKYSGAVVGSISIEQDAGDYYLDISAGTTIGGNTIIHSGNIGSQSVNYATTAGSAPASDVYSWAKAATKPSYTLDEVTDGSTRKLSNYLPLTGGTIAGDVNFADTATIIFDTDSSIYYDANSVTDFGLIVTGQDAIRFNIDDNSSHNNVLVITGSGVAVTGALTVGGNTVATQTWVGLQPFFKRIDAVTLPALVSADTKAIYVIPSENPVTGNLKEEWCVVEVLRVSIGNEYVDVMDKGTALGWEPEDYSTYENMAGRGDVLLITSATGLSSDAIDVCEVPYDGVNPAEWGGYGVDYGTAYTISGTKYVYVPTGWKAISTLTTTTERRWEKIGGGSGSGTVNQIKVGNTVYNPTLGVVSLPAYPTTLPASDVYAWAKAATKPSYTLDEVSDGTTRKLANYLPLTGGTIASTSGDTPLIIKSKDTDCYIQFRDKDGISIGYIGCENNAPMFYDISSHTIWHSGNLTNVSQLTNDSGYITSSSLSNYLPLSGGTMTGGNISWNSDSHGIYFYGGCGIEKWLGYGPSLVGEGSAEFAISSSSNRAVRYSILHSGNWSSYIGTQNSPVAYASLASSAGSAGSATYATSAGNADTVDSLHASDFLRHYNDSSLNANDAAVGWHDVANLITNAAHSNHSTLIYVNNVGTPFQLQIPDSSEPYIYKRYYSGGWQSWFKISAGYADSAGSVAWTNVSGRPTNVSSFTNDSGYITSSALGSYLPLSGGTLTGNLYISGNNVISFDVDNSIYADSYGADTRLYINGYNGIYLAVNHETQGGVALPCLDISDNGISTNSSISATGNIYMNSNLVATQTWVGNQGYLTSASLNGYATQTWVGQNYLALSGGTMTGTLVVNAGSSKFGPSLDHDTYKYYHAMYLGTHGVDEMKLYEDAFYFYSNGGGTPTVYIGGNACIHSGNIASQSVSHASTATTATYASYDTEGYVLASEDWVQNRGYVTSSGSVAYATSAGSVPQTRRFAFEAGGSNVGWVSVAKMQLVEQNYFDFVSMTAHICRQYALPSSESYSISITFGWVDATCKLLSKNVGSQIIQKFRVALDSTNHVLYLQVYVNPSYTTYANLSAITLVGELGGHDWTSDNTVNNNVTGVTELDLSVGTTVDKLQTARTIWGQSFDGTGNVNGNLVLSSSTGSTENYDEGIRINSVFSNPLIHFGGSGNAGTGANQWSIGLHNGRTYWALTYNAWTNYIITSDTNGNVGIGTNTPSYKLDVNGNLKLTGSGTQTPSIYLYNSATGTGAKINFFTADYAMQFSEANEYDFDNQVYVDGDVNATGGIYGGSDARRKNIYDYNALVDVNTIAMAPAVRFKWNDGVDEDLHCGSIAQYWYSVMPECVRQDRNGYLSMQYDVIALLASISIAKKVMNHEERITELEKENERLRTELEQLRA